MQLKELTHSACVWRVIHPFRSIRNPNFGYKHNEFVRCLEIAFLCSGKKMFSGSIYSAHAFMYKYQKFYSNFVPSFDGSALKAWICEYEKKTRRTNEKVTNICAQLYIVLNWCCAHKFNRHMKYVCVCVLFIRQSDFWVRVRKHVRVCTFEQHRSFNIFCCEHRTFRLVRLFWFHSIRFSHSLYSLFLLFL